MISGMLKVNGVDLDGVGFSFSSYSGLRRLPVKRLGTVEIPGYNGVVPSLSVNSFEPNEVVLRMWAASDDCSHTARIAGYNSILDMLFHLFGPLDRLLDLRQAMGDGSIRQAYVRVLDEIVVPTNGYPGSEYVVTLQIPAAFWQDVTASTWSGTASDTSPHNRTVTPLTGSTAPIEDAVYLVDGPAGPGVRITCPDTGGWVGLNRALGAGEVWRVDSGKWRSEIGSSGMGFGGAATEDVIAVTEYAGSGVRLLTMVPVVDWQSVPADQVTNANNRLVKLTLSGSGFGGTTRLHVQARRKFL